LKKSNVQIVLSYFSFLWKSKSIHGIHSPFLYHLINAIGKQKVESFFVEIEKERQRLLQDNTLLEGTDYGAGSRKKAFKSIKQVAKTALKKQKEARVLYAIAKHLKAKNILELGTSLGITTSYFACSNSGTNVISMEGNKSISAEAKKVFENLNLGNIKIIEGNIDLTLSKTLSLVNDWDLVFIDANHKKEPCIRYFNQILNHCHNETILIFDDIHWSDEMEEAWKQIKKNEKVKVSVDLFHFGLIFFREQMSEQHFTIRI